MEEVKSTGREASATELPLSGVASESVQQVRANILQAVKGRRGNRHHGLYVCGVNPPPPTTPSGQRAAMKIALQGWGLGSPWRTRRAAKGCSYHLVCQEGLERRRRHPPEWPPRSPPSPCPRGLSPASRTLPCQINGPPARSLLPGSPQARPSWPPGWT
ncbi:uncharacterized protein LOC110084401 [Pogona vitticeps]